MTGQMRAPSHTEIKGSYQKNEIGLDVVIWESAQVIVWSEKEKKEFRIQLWMWVVSSKFDLEYEYNSIFVDIIYPSTHLSIWIHLHTYYRQKLGGKL